MTETDIKDAVAKAGIKVHRNAIWPVDLFDNQEILMRTVLLYHIEDLVAYLLIDEYTHFTFFEMAQNINADAGGVKLRYGAWQ